MARIVGLGALKYFLLKVDARKNMVFNPEESIDFNGNKDENTKEVVQKCLDAGLEVGAWTIDDMDTLQSLKDKGVTYITTDSITY